MQVEHPRAVSDAGPVPANVDVDGTIVTVDEDGYFEVPDEKRGWLERYARRHGVRYDDEGQCKRPEGWPDETFDDEDDGEDGTDESETCEVVKNDGEVCGRELPCPYHSEDESEEDE